jgi:cyanate lyase
MAVVGTHRQRLQNLFGRDCPHLTPTLHDAIVGFQRISRRGAIVDRAELTDLIATTRVQKGLTWSEVAEAVGASKEWVTAGCLGQMTFDAAQAKTLVTLFELPTEALQLLQTPPHRGSLRASVPSDPLIYRFYELVSVYGTTFKELIQEEFGDGIMSAIDFEMEITRREDPAGDRVNIVMSGKFLPYKRY